MSRMPRAGGRYVRPIKTDGTELVDEVGRGKYTLASGTTYYYVLGGADAPFLSAHVSGDAAIVITSIMVQDCDHGEVEVTDFGSTAGDWIPEAPSTVRVTGTGWSVSSGVVAVAGTGAGGAMIQVPQTAAKRARLEVIVGSTGGVLRVSSHGKD